MPPEQWRNPRHLRFLREQGACVACGYEMRDFPRLKFFPQAWVAAVQTGHCEPMHGPVNGTSSKGPDAEAIPGCAKHHREMHKIDWPAFESKYGFSRAEEAAHWWGISPANKVNSTG